MVMTAIQGIGYYTFCSSLTKVAEKKPLNKLVFKKIAFRLTYQTSFNLIDIETPASFSLWKNALSLLCSN